MKTVTVTIVTMTMITVTIVTMTMITMTTITMITTCSFVSEGEQKSTGAQDKQGKQGIS